MPSAVPPWRSFLALPSNNEAASASVCCHFSFATLEVACCHPGTASFALTEQRHPDVWRWAICSTQGLTLQAGCEPTQADAKRVAEEALQMEEAFISP
jgi:pyrroline-5-carboxylate reductase